MRFFKTCWLAIAMRLRRKARISLKARLKGHGNIQVGRGVKIHEGATVDGSRGGRVAFGDGTTLNREAYLQGGRGGITLHAGVEINSFAMIDGTGGVEIEAGTLIGPGVRIISYAHNFHGRRPVREQASTPRKISIGKDVWIGANAIILAGVSVGEGAIVGAGAVVTRDVPAWAVVVGVPARVAKIRESEDLTGNH